MNQRYNAIGKLKTIFKNILQKSSDGEHIPEPDHTMVVFYILTDVIVVRIAEASW